MGCIGCENSKNIKEGNNIIKESFIDFPLSTPLSEIEPTIESKYLFEESMNGGKYGTSMKIRDKITKNLYRIKILHKTSLLKFKKISNVINYYKDMMIFNNQYVNKIIGVYQNSDNILPVCDYSNKENLYYYLYTKKKKISFEEFIFIIICILNGLKYLDEKGYIHGHLTLQNIILFNDNNIFGYIPKITDYSHYINFYDNYDNELKNVKNNINQFFHLFENHFYKYLENENIKKTIYEILNNKNIQSFDSLITFFNSLKED